MLLAPGIDLTGDALPVLLNELRDLPEAVLVLDDYHAVKNSEVDRIVAFLLEHGSPL